MDIYCPYCAVSPSPTSDFRNLTGHGSYFRTSDSKWIARFKCNVCTRTISRATMSVHRHEKKRRINALLFRLLSGAMSQREAARVLKVHRNTVDRRLPKFGAIARAKVHAMNAERKRSAVVEFDDMESCVATKLKPLSMLVVVESRSRWILDLGVAAMPPKGPMAAFAREKYGPQVDERGEVREKVFRRLQSVVQPTAVFKSDRHPHYPPTVKKIFPLAEHVTVKSRRARLFGQGELKTGGFDPIFSLNHTAAMFRAHVGRLIRKTWNISKKKENLEAHMFLYALSHNQRILKKSP